MKKEFVMRGKTASGGTQVLEFGGRQKENKNMAYKLTELSLYPSTNLISQNAELCASVTAGKTAVAPTDPDFSFEGLIATAMLNNESTPDSPKTEIVVLNDTYMITQNLILMVIDSQGNPVNWQCRFEAVKMTDAETAATNFKQFTIFDE